MSQVIILVKLSRSDSEVSMSLKSCKFLMTNLRFSWILHRHVFCRGSGVYNPKWVKLTEDGG